MINRINKISNIGIYRDFNNNGELDDFKQFNLFYGWNGSGKSSLTKVFRMLETNNISDKDGDVEFEFLINDKEINQKNLDQASENIFVFNKSFIQDNIDWDDKIESILIISEEKIKEYKEYNTLKEEIYGNKDKKIKGKEDEIQ